MAAVLFGIGMIAYIAYCEIKHARRIRRWRTHGSPYIVRGDQPLGHPDD